MSVQKEFWYAVFVVFTDMTPMLVARYCELRGGISRGAVIPKVTEVVAKRYPHSEVQFKFWVNSVENMPAEDPYVFGGN